MLLEMLNYCGSKDAGTTPKHLEATPSPPTLLCGLHASLNIRGIVTLLITEPLDQEFPSLEAFFQSPLVPPRLPSTYLRVLLENVTGSLDLSGTLGNQTDTAHISPITSNIFLSNLSVFLYHYSRTVDKDAAQVSLPLLITDHHLHNQYIVSPCRPFFSSTPIPAQPLSGVTLPTFEVVDWTAVKLAGGSSKLSNWRVKPSIGKDPLAHSPSSKSSAFPTSPSPPTVLLLKEEELEELSLSSAITFVARIAPVTARSAGSTDILVRIAPLHVFFDVDIMLEDGSILKFLDEALAFEGSPARDASDTSQGRSSLDDTEEEDSAGDDELNTPFITPKQLERERERRRLERLVLDDLDLDIDYRTGAPSRQRPNSKRATNTKFKVDESVICKHGLYI
jgi:autophagy-related protein 2